MLQSLRNRRNRKGFTLAELLIVVAIIAVLVAIAVPLFVGSLNKAEEATQNANIRAVRGTAAVYLLENTNGDNKAKLWPNGVESWDVTATVSKNGSITIDSIKAYPAGTSATFTEDKATKQNDGSYKVTLNLKNTEVTGVTVQDAAVATP